MNALLAQMQAMQQATSGQPVSNLPSVASDSNGVDFKTILKNAVQDVSNAQNSAQAKVQAFSTGDSNMSLEEVMVSLQKANISFQGMLAVRNRLVDAYKEVTNLQV
ncbi:flagellar hook-basal body complex protein FliE [Polynucleobacter sp. 30F-ANTBAC]|nr:flagellar hook-basal body complex protein FliE [Polynucleobacter sp. 30F-ANTBAC]